MPSEKFQTRLPNDTAEAVHQYVEDRNISQAEAIRRLIEAGLTVEAGDTTTDETALSTANIHSTVRLIGGATIGLMVLFLFLSEVGLI